MISCGEARGVDTPKPFLLIPRGLAGEELTSLQTGETREISVNKKIIKCFPFNIESPNNTELNTIKIIHNNANTMYNA